MKRNLRLLLPILSILLTLACLGTPKPTGIPVSTPTATNPSPSAGPTSTALPAQLAGLKIAYILDGNVWLWDGITPTRQLTSEGDAISTRISSDGLLIAYVRPNAATETPSVNESSESLWIINVDGSEPREVLNIKHLAASLFNRQRIDYFFSNIYEFKFQPNSHRIYFSTSQNTGTGIVPSNDLYLANTEPIIVSLLLYKRDGGQFTFSPSGNLLAVSSFSHIQVMQWDGSSRESALSYPAISPEVGLIPQVVWMDNETGFYTVLPDNSGISSRYLFVSVDGSFSAQLSEFDSVFTMISPDGLKVAYVNQTATNFELGMIEASNTNTIIASYEGAPFIMLWNWSPDSKRVTFSNAHPVLLLTAGIGIPPSPLTESVTPYSLRWVSADRFIFFREGELLVGQINNPETISIASGFANDLSDTKHYDFTINSLP